MKLIIGILLIVMSIIHVIYGEKKLVNELRGLRADNLLIGSFRVMSVQGGLLLFAIGLIEIMSYIGTIKLSGFASFFPSGVIFLNIISCLMISIFKHRELLKMTLPQLFIFIIIFVLQLLSIR